MNRLGYCCQNLTLGRNFRIMQLNRSLRDIAAAEQKWQEVTNHNLQLLFDIIDWNIENKIWLYRISSDLIPLADHPAFNHLFLNLNSNPFIRLLQNKLQEYIALGGRLTIHPSQFVSIGSANETTRNNSINNLIYHGQLLDMLGLPQNHDCPINIHVSNGTKPIVDTVNNIAITFSLLPDNVLKRLVFENEQSGCWTVDNLFKEFIDIPITFDFHHYLVNKSKDTLMYAARDLAIESWPNNDPVMHYSQGKNGQFDPAHSDYITHLPVLLEGFDVEIEAKKKDLALLAIRDKMGK